MVNLGSELRVALPRGKPAVPVFRGCFGMDILVPQIGSPEKEESASSRFFLEVQP